MSWQAEYYDEDHDSVAANRRIAVPMQDVSFKDPLNNLAGKAELTSLCIGLLDHLKTCEDSYKANVEMLSGDSLVGPSPRHKFC